MRFTTRILVAIGVAVTLLSGVPALLSPAYLTWLHRWGPLTSLCLLLALIVSGVYYQILDDKFKELKKSNALSDARLKDSTAGDHLSQYVGKQVEQECNAGIELLAALYADDGALRGLWMEKQDDSNLDLANHLAINVTPSVLARGSVARGLAGPIRDPSIRRDVANY